MINTSASPSPATIRASTGYSRLDNALRGGFNVGSAVVLSAPASDEVPILLQNFLKASQGRARSLLICRNAEPFRALAQGDANARVLACSERPVSPARNILQGKGVENLTELNLEISGALSSIQPTRVGLDVLSDILLRHKALQTRKWLGDLLTKLRSQNVTTLAVINSHMHPREEVEAVVDLFDGNLEIVEAVVEGQSTKLLRIRWMHGIEVADRELPLAGLISAARPRSAAFTTKERVDDLSMKFDVIMKRLDTIETLLASGRESSDLATILRGLRAGVSLYNQPVQALKRLYDAQDLIEKEATEKDEISRLIVEALAMHGSMNISQLTREVHSARGRSSRRIIRERVQKLLERATIRPREGPGKRYELAK